MQSEEPPTIPWLEILLGLSVVALVFQVFPSLWFGLLGALDFRNWTWSIWAGLNALVIVVLLFIRAWRNR